MDVSPEYLKMCEKAEEIQALWTCSCGDWYIDTITFPEERIIEVIGGHYPQWEDDDYDYSYALHQQRSFWLPRQDQLQGMVDLTTEQLVESFYDFVTNCAHYEEERDGRYISISKLTQFIKDRLIRMKSFEQLWLAFVMEIRFYKVWDGERWI